MALAFPAEFRVKNLEHVAASVAVNAKGDRLAIGLAMGSSQDPSLQILDVASGDVLGVHAPATEICRGVAFGRDDDLYFLADDRREIRLSRLSGRGRQIETVDAFPPDTLMNTLVCDRAGKLLAVVGRRVEVRRLPDGAVIRRFEAAEPQARTIAGPPVFIRDELMVAPPKALNLTSMEALMMPLYTPGNIIATAVAADAPVIAFSHREGALIWGRLQ